MNIWSWLYWYVNDLSKQTFSMFRSGLRFGKKVSFSKADLFHIKKKSKKIKFIQTCSIVKYLRNWPTRLFGIFLDLIWLESTLLTKTYLLTVCFDNFKGENSVRFTRFKLTWSKIQSFLKINQSGRIKPQQAAPESSNDVPIEVSFISI